MFKKAIGGLLLLFSLQMSAQQFIQVQGNEFQYEGKPYYFLGANFWYGMNLGSSEEGGDRERLIRELDELAALGVKNLRVMAGSEGPNSEPWRMSPALQSEPGVYDKALLEGLDFLLAEMGKRDMHAVMCLNNFWQWSGGMAQYVSWSDSTQIPYPNLFDGKGWWEYMMYTAKFYKDKKAQDLFNSFLKTIIERTNSISGIKYKMDPTIMSWQLANEPRGPKYRKHYRKWLNKTAAFIKTMDSNHLVSTGSEGTTPGKFNGNRVKKDHKSKNIDYVTIHIWIQNWGWYDPIDPVSSYPFAIRQAKNYLKTELRQVKSLKKPIVIEEFGIARDANDHDWNSTTIWRDRYFKDLFSTIYDYAKSGRGVSGGNFWAWSGEGRPVAPKAVWKKGDPFIGDPPHEYQGWYSIYNTDITTINVIKKYAALMEELNKKK